MINGHFEDSLVKDVAAGVIGGLAASWVMAKFMEGGVQLMERRGYSKAAIHKRMPSTPEGEEPTVKTATVVAQTVLTRRLSKRQKEHVGPAVHYSFGTFLGAVYGALACRLPGVGAGWGLPYGSAVWLGASETALPLLKLSKPPAHYPSSTHLFGLAAHWVYGLTLYGVCSLAHRLMEGNVRLPRFQAVRRPMERVID
ncbi:MAG: DUF1440 domain-containing protein [Elusimicrobia bacterium]|nr:DUF1440 domain-containing protein [Elusimicrobiota bacterium]